MKKDSSREGKVFVTCNTLARDDGGLAQGSGCGDGEKWSGS